MSIASDPSTDTDTTTSTTPALDWDLVPFKVECARCGQDLKGLTDPTCPACGLDFDWSDAVPLEELTCLHCGYHLYGLTKTRCPECGERFTWEEVLDEFRRHRKPFFEYQWRRHPFQSLRRTWRWAVWPPNFWRRFDIHDPPQVGPLLSLVVLSLAVLFVLIVLLSGLDKWVWMRLWVSRRVGATGGAWGDLPWYLLGKIAARETYTTLLTAVAWVGMNFAALMVFRQSMRRCKVRTVHVIRVWAHATSLMLPVVVIIISFTGFTIAFAGIRHIPGTELMVTLLFLAHVTWSGSCAYRTYLRMPHSLAVAIAAETMAVLATFVLCLAFIPWSFGTTILDQIADLLGIY